MSAGTWSNVTVSGVPPVGITVSAAPDRGHMPDVPAGRIALPDRAAIRRAVDRVALMPVVDDELAEAIARRAFELDAYDLLTPELKRRCACARYAATESWAVQQERCEHCRWVKEAHPQFARGRLLRFAERFGL